MLAVGLTSAIKTWKNTLSAAVPLVIAFSLREVWVWMGGRLQGINMIREWKSRE
jgi:hypothetical protein